MIMSQIPETSSVIGEERVYLRNIHTPYAVRRFTHAILAEWDLMPMVEDVELVATELATNAIRNALGDTIAVRIERAEGSEGSVCVKVWDDNPEPPVPQAPETDAESGRGLLITAALSAQSGHYRVPTGKVVWASLPERSR